MYNELKKLYTSLGPGGLARSLYKMFPGLYILLVRVFVNKTLTTVSNP